MTLNENEIYQTLQEQFYIPVPFGIEPNIITDAVNAFFRFLQEPDEIKQHIDFTIAPKHRRGDVGFKHREADEGIYNDNKDFFHFHPAIFEQYDEFLKANPIVYDFILKAQPIWELTYSKIYQILSAFEPQFPGVVSNVFDTEHVHILLRFLKYEWEESGKYLAKPHFDAGSFTLAIAESGPGLRIGSCPDNLQLVKHQEGNAVFMLSSNFRKIMNSEDLSPGWHDVVQLDEALIGKPYARWAVVAFIEASEVEALPRSETHKWFKEETVSL
jgi:hypothetical protein